MEIIQNGHYLATVPRPAAVESKEGPEIVQIPNLNTEVEIVQFWD